MKAFLISFCALTVSAVSLCAQSSPAAPPPNKPAVQSTSLTKEERDHAIEYLKQSQKDFLAAIDGLSDAQWKFKPAPDRWSVAEVAEHIAIAEEMIWQMVNEKIMKSPATPEKRAEVQGKDEIVLKMVPDRSHKVQAPEQLKPTGRFATREELIKTYESARAQEIAYLMATNDDLRDHFGDHPALKTLDAYQWLLLNGAHCKRHTAQIVEVKADPNFPKS